MIAQTRVVGRWARALAVEFDYNVGAQDGVVLLAASPLMQLGRCLPSMNRPGIPGGSDS
jgi:hypothetical protein